MLLTACAMIYEFAPYRRDLLQHVGKIVRLNQKSATVACDEGEWRVSYALLHRIVEV